MAYNISDTEKKKGDITDWLASEYKSIQTGRATPAVLDLVHIDMYGSRTPIAHTGSINIEDPRTLRVAPWDKGIIGQMEKAINKIKKEMEKAARPFVGRRWIERHCSAFPMSGMAR